MQKSLLALGIAFALSACSPQNSTSSNNKSSTATEAQQEQALSSGIIKANMDLSVNPGDDFFKYVNGKWLETVEIPADKASYGAFRILRDESQEDVMDIIKSSSEGDFAQGSDEQKVGDFYRAYMDMETRDALGASPLTPELAKIDAIENYTQLAEYFAYANKYGFGVPFAMGQYADFKTPENYMIYTWQAGLGLPEREFYFKDDEASQKIRDAYVPHIEKMLSLVGDENAADNAAKLMAMETEIAGMHMQKELTRDWATNYNKVMTPELTSVMPKFDWDAFLKEARLTELDGVVMMQTDFMKQMDDYIASTSLEDWKLFLRWGLLRGTATRLSSDFDQANFDFYSRVLSGLEEKPPQWRRAVSLLNNHVGEIIGKVYVKRHFPPEAKARMTEMVNNLLLAYKESIEQLDWMTDDTRKEALDKLSKFTVKIGYPDEWKDYTALTVNKDDLFGNLKRSADANYEELLKKQGGPVWKQEWGMTPQTVNAYYSPPQNEIVFPAAILQPPFFDMNAEDAVNYGGIGAVIGHEIGHGFDDSGSTFDGDGVLRNWWTDEDRKEFEARTAKLIEQYSAFEALEGLNVNGEYTLGENIGDLGGISIALNAYHLSLNGEPAPVIDGFTGDQRVFIGFGQVWAVKFRDEALRNLIETDTHSPGPFRANGSVRNVPEFYSAFDVKPENALYLAPDDRVKIW